MANEYLKRTPTSTGNRKTFTISFWKKHSQDGSAALDFSAVGNTVNDNNNRSIFYWSNVNSFDYFHNVAGVTKHRRIEPVDNNHRDFSSWSHVLVSTDTTKNESRIYLNGVEINYNSVGTVDTLNYETWYNSPYLHTIGSQFGLTFHNETNYFDWFLVDGQALTPEVFGFYKDGNGYISAGSTQATDFRNGQWVPRTPREIKNLINDNGGFGVNGFYLPMNDSSNFGADFHTTPNSIITLKGENLAQPRNGAPTTTDAYVSQLRTDPYAANLVLAVPGIIGAPGVAYTDFSANIKGSGTNKVITANGNAGVAATASYYGSALSLTGVAGTYFSLPNSSDLRLGSDDFTIECWVNINSSASDGFIFGAWNVTDNRRSYVLWSDNGSISFNGSTNGSDSNNPNFAITLPRINQWNHVAVEKESNTVTLYINGVSVGIATNTTALYDNTQDNFIIGGEGGGSNREFNGYIQDLRVYKGVAKYKGGFDVPKPYTPVGISTWRAVSDTCQNNFATLNPLYPRVLTSGTDRTFSNGNLTGSGITNGIANLISNMGVSYGQKIYFEVRQDSRTGGSVDVGFIGIKGIGEYDYPGNNSTATYYYGNNGTKYKYVNGAATITGASYGDSYTDGDIIGISIDSDGTVVMYKNGISQGTIDTFTEAQYPLFLILQDGSSGSLHTYTVNFGQNPTFSGNTTAGTYTDSNGKGLFKYQPPSGFLALCEDNLPTPTIKDPGEHFKTVLYTGALTTGSGSSGTLVSGVGFQPDLIWIKNRSRAGTNGDGYSDHALFDSVRGYGGLLSSNYTGAENTSDPTNRLTGVHKDGFSVGYYYVTGYSGDNYVAWCWKAGGPAVTNTDGSIISQVSVNQDAGFSIVSYTGIGANATVGHGLGKTPSFVIVKNREASTDWTIYHKSITATKGLFFTTAGVSTSINYWNNTEPTSSVISLGISGGTNNTNKTIAYCWAEIEGFSKFGSYVGNGNADGPFVYCGFKPAWVMIKRSNATDNWYINDSSRNSINVTGSSLMPNLSNIEASIGGAFSATWDILSNGFKLRDSGTGTNASGSTYIFAAFAESPFQTANAK